MVLYVEELDLARERAMVVREEMLSNLAQDQNSKMLLTGLGILLVFRRKRWM